MESQWEVSGKTVLITGGASGLGAGKVEALLKGGAKAIAILDVAETAAKQLIARCQPNSDRITFIKCDVTDEGKLTEVFERVLTNFKSLDVIINCAGIMDDSPGQWSKSCDINLDGDFFERTHIRVLTICYSTTNTAILTNLKLREYDENRGKYLEDRLTPATFQTVESAVKSFMDMLRNGASGSVWFSGENKPGKDITAAIDEAYGVLQRAME